MKHSLLYGEEKITYNILPNSKMIRKIRIHVHPNCKVDVEAPENHGVEEIKVALQKRARWIHQQISLAKEVQQFAVPREYVSGETHFYLGKRYQLKVIKTITEPSSVKLKGGKIFITSRTKDPAAIRRRLSEWYNIKAENYLPNRIDKIAKNISWLKNTPPVKLVKMKKQWGSCAPSGAVHLNPWLIKAPTDCIDYVLVHEICHIKERNHGKKYYQLLSQHYPNWKPIKTKLDGMAELLLVT